MFLPFSCISFCYVINFCFSTAAAIEFELFVPFGNFSFVRLFRLIICHHHHHLDSTIEWRKQKNSKFNSTIKRIHNNNNNKSQKCFVLWILWFRFFPFFHSLWLFFSFWFMCDKFIPEILSLYNPLLYILHLSCFLFFNQFGAHKISIFIKIHSFIQSTTTTTAKKSQNKTSMSDRLKTLIFFFFDFFTDFIFLVHFFNTFSQHIMF